MLKNRSVLAGIFIGIGGYVFLSASYKELGAFLFSLGLLTVIIRQYSLYTGKIGYLGSIKELPPLLLMWVGNALGACLMGFLASLALKDCAFNLISKKLELDYLSVFLRSVMCGVLIYIAVELYKKTQMPILVILPIMVFILCGFEHCIADVFYFSAALSFNIESLVFIIICTFGNSVGSIALRLLEKYNI